MLNVIFAGTPDFACPTLEALIASAHQVKAVYTQPDRPKGRGKVLTASPVKKMAQEHNLEVLTPVNFQLIHDLDQLKLWGADIMVVVAYGLLLPETVLSSFRFGCINIHPSKLPRWRGAAPIQFSLLAGDIESGVTIMQMDAGMDTGPIIMQQDYRIQPKDTSGTLHADMAQVGAHGLIEVLDQIDQRQKMLALQAQSEQGVTYTKKITKADARVDWSESVKTIHNKIRAFNPWPIASTSLEGEVIRIYKASVLDQEHRVKAGSVLAVADDGIDIACGQGVCRLQVLQYPGKKPMDVKTILCSRRESWQVGQTILGL